jgi:hypothetical protein
LGRKHKFWEDKGRGLTVVTVMAKEQKLGTMATKELENILWQKSKFNFLWPEKNLPNSKVLKTIMINPIESTIQNEKLKIKSQTHLSMIFLHCVFFLWNYILHIFGFKT